MILFIVSFISCEMPQDKNPEIISKNGIIYKQGELKPYTGSVKDTINGKVIEYFVLDGKKNGGFKSFFKNGKLEMSGYIKENLNQGKWSYFYESGKLECDGYFKDDLPDGSWKWYFENGVVKEEGKYLNGNREGKWIQYDLDGKIKDEKKFRKNLEVDN